MNIEAEKFNIQMTQSELWNTACDVRRSIQDAVSTHWVNHQQHWKEGESERLYRCRSMFTALGRIDMYEDILREAEIVFAEFNQIKQDKPKN